MEEIHDDGNRIRYRWAIDKELMLAEDVDNIIKIQEALLQSDNPFLEDYYFQNYMNKRNPSEVSEDIMYRHSPISECFHPAGTMKTKYYGKDPLEGVLGRTPGHSVRAPRPLVELKGNAIETEEKQLETPTEDVDGGGFARALVGRSNLPRTILLSIENIFSTVIEVEDLNFLVSINVDDRSPDSRTTRQSLYDKCVEKINHLFTSLRTTPNPTPQQGNPEGFYAKEDEFFVRVISISKGAKMLARAIPLLNNTQVLTVISVILRNLHIIVHLPTNDESDQRLRTFFAVIVAILNGIPLTQFLNCFQQLISYNSGAPYLQRRLVRTIKTKIGMLVFTTFLQKGFEVTFTLLQQQRQLNSRIEEIQKIVATWKQLYDQLYEQLQEKLSSLFNTAVTLPPANPQSTTPSIRAPEVGFNEESYGMSAGYSNGALSDWVWQFFVLLALNATPYQKQEMWKELSPIVGSVEQTTAVTNFLHVMRAQQQV
uniref:mRNA decay factor PAT1 domain-containing protein n=1 Tax=Arcella intermedia TaxID=1963864 RepID=A0A6B2L2W4_9EUKA